MTGQEYEKITKVEQIFKEKGFKTFREVIPDMCKSWKKPYRVDMIVYRHDVGFIGAEGKDWNTLTSGKKFYDLLKQVDKYKNLTFFNGKKLDKFCILAFIDDKFDRIWDFIRGFVKQTEIGLMEYKKYNWFEQVIIDKLNNNKAFKIYNQPKGLEAFECENKDNIISYKN